MCFSLCFIGAPRKKETYAIVAVFLLMVSILVGVATRSPNKCDVSLNLSASACQNSLKIIFFSFKNLKNMRRTPKRHTPQYQSGFILGGRLQTKNAFWQCCQCQKAWKICLPQYICILTHKKLHVFYICEKYKMLRQLCLLNNIHPWIITIIFAWTVH